MAGYVLRTAQVVYEDDEPRICQVAEAYGIPYQLVVDRADLASAVKRMLDAKGPFVLECAVMEEDNVLPMTPPGMSVDEMMLDINV